MKRYLAKRLLSSLATILGIVVVVFFIVRVVPGDAAALRAGPYATQARIDQIAAKYGLSEPIGEQFVDYMSNVARGDLGVSIRTDQPVLGELLDRLPASLELAVYSVLLAMLIGIPLGVLAAAKRGTWIDNLARVFAVVGSSMALFGSAEFTFLAFRLGWFRPGRPARVVTNRVTVRLLHDRRSRDGGFVNVMRSAPCPTCVHARVRPAPRPPDVRWSLIASRDQGLVRLRGDRSAPTHILFVDLPERADPDHT